MQLSPPPPPSMMSYLPSPEYVQNLHKIHKKKVILLTLECILFSSSDEAVFAGQYDYWIAGQNRKLTEIVKLDEPKLILLDSKRLKHAAQRNAAAARAAFN
jgi:hypothetical protein